MKRGAFVVIREDNRKLLDDFGSLTAASRYAESQAKSVGVGKEIQTMMICQFSR